LHRNKIHNLKREKTNNKDDSESQIIRQKIKSSQREGKELDLRQCKLTLMMLTIKIQIKKDNLAGEKREKSKQKDYLVLKNKDKTWYS